MNAFLERLANWFASWKPWVVVPPWSQGVRVRLGKDARKLLPGLHFRIPGVDQIILVNTRLRTVVTWEVTKEEVSKPGWTVTRQALIGFRIVDPLKAMLSFEQPGSAVMMLGTSVLAEFDNEEDFVRQLKLLIDDKGIEFDFCRTTLNMKAKSLRLLQNAYTHNSGSDGSPALPGITNY